MLSHPDKIYPGQKLRIPPGAVPAAFLSKTTALLKRLQLGNGQLMR